MRKNIKLNGKLLTKCPIQLDVLVMGLDNDSVRAHVCGFKHYLDPELYIYYTIHRLNIAEVPFEGQKTINQQTTQI